MTAHGRVPIVAIDLRPPPLTNRKVESMDEQTQAFSLKPGQGRSLPAPAGRVTFKVRGKEAGGTMTVFEAEVPPGTGPRLHVHEHSDECIYVLSGDVQIRLGHELRDAPAGSFAFIPRGVHHRYQNVGQTNSRIIAMFTPAGIEDFFESFAKNRSVDDFFAGLSASGTNAMSLAIDDHDPRP
jgi:mannose-6-phosphate isomerase-like protein (cupin superfamily)